MGWWNVSASDSYQIAPPLDSNAFIIQTNLVLEDLQAETINLITAYATSSHCEVTINLTACSFQSGVGEYEVSIHRNEIDMLSLGTPQLVAMANNSAVNRTWDPDVAAYRSTLAGIVDLMNVRWGGRISFYKPPGELPSAITDSTAPVVIYRKVGDAACPSYRDPHRDVVSSLNMLMVYLGAFATTSGFVVRSGLDPGSYHKRTVIDGYPEGLQSVFHTDYWFFFAATLIEVVCVALVAPTYWGWWKIGRPVSTPRWMREPLCVVIIRRKMRLNYRSRFRSRRSKWLRYELAKAARRCTMLT